MQVYALNDCDWWIGESLEACIADYRDHYCDDPDAIDEDAHELTELELDSYRINVLDEDGKWIGDDRSFREQLAIEIAEGGVFPRMFATTEY